MIELVNLKKINAMHANEIHNAVDKVVDSGWYLKGNATECFEHDYAAYIAKILRRIETMSCRAAV